MVGSLSRGLNGTLIKLKESRVKNDGIIKRYLGKHMTTYTKLRLHNATSKATLCYGS
jgi:hypothetical protein